jgi:hypothetical protein
VLFQAKAFGQYSFEKFPAIKTKVFNSWKFINEQGKLTYTLTIPRFFKGGNNLTVTITPIEQEGNDDSSVIKILSNHQVLKQYIQIFPLGLNSLNTPDSAYVGDFNGDGLTDVKFYLPNHGCGAYNFYATVVYLLVNAQ